MANHSEGVEGYTVTIGEQRGGIAGPAGVIPGAMAGAYAGYIHGLLAGAMYSGINLAMTGDPGSVEGAMVTGAFSGVLTGFPAGSWRD